MTPIATHVIDHRTHRAHCAHYTEVVVAGALYWYGMEWSFAMHPSFVVVEAISRPL
jgi:hypothetical protein